MRLLSLEVELSGAARRALTPLAIAAGVWLLPRPAVASEVMRLDYRAPLECPDVPVFVERVKKRIPSARLATPDELARAVTIVVGFDEDGYMARLDFVDVRGETITRTLSGSTCDEVVSGIALVTALALEAQRELSREVGADPAAPSAETPGDAPPAADAPVQAEPGPPAPVAPSPVAPPPPPRDEPPRREPRRSGFSHGAGVGGGNAWYVAPGTPAVFDATFRLAHASLPGSARAGFRSWISTLTLGDRSARFLGYAGTLEACPIEWPRTGRVRLELCLGVTLGVLEGEGERTQSLPLVDSARIFWADARAVPRLRAALTRLVELEGQAEVGMPLRTHRFLFQDPEETVFDVPSVGLGWRAGVMLHFP